MQSNGFEFVSVIGYGSFGVIFLVYSPKYDQRFAIKRVWAKRFNGSEIEVMKTVDHQNIVRLYNYQFLEDNVYMVMEYCPETIERLVSSNGALHSADLISMTKEILLAIQALHSNKISHGDIKPSNFLVDQYNRVKVADFGFSRFMNTNNLSHFFVGSIPFMSPEILNKVPHDPFKSDVWALGIVFYFMAVGNLPWAIKSKDRMLSIVKNNLVNTNLIPNKTYAKFVAKMLQKEQEKRPTVSELLNDPIFKESSYKNGTKLIKQVNSATWNSTTKKQIIKPFICVGTNHAIIKTAISFRKLNFTNAKAPNKQPTE